MKSKHYRVTWEIDVWATSAKDAATQALDTQRDPNSIATVFEVVDMRTKHTIDVMDKS